MGGHSATDATTTYSSSANPTIEPFTTGLNGIDQASNKKYQDVLFVFLGGIGFTVLLVRIAELSRAWVRHKIAMGQPAGRQNYWKENGSEWWPWIKRQVTYAPLWKKRHNRDFRVSSAVNVGTLPSRLHTVLLTIYLLSNMGYCAALDYTVENNWSVAAQLRGRSGTLAVANLIPVVIFAGRNNPLIPLLHISFDTYNLMHRWMGRMVVLETVVHTLAWLITQIASDGWASVNRKVIEDPFISWGTAGTLLMIVMMVLSPSPLRHAFYETFLTAHITMAFLVIVGVWVHCELGHLPQVPYCKAILGIWLVERLWRVMHLAKLNFSRHRTTEATVEALDGEACRVTITLPKFVNIKPGTHAYLRFWKCKAWESHPFSIAWVEHTSKDEKDSLPKYEKDAPPLPPRDLDTTAVSFIISAHTGMTRALYQSAQAIKASKRDYWTMGAAMEGPYGGHHSLDSYGHCVLFAGSSGITHQLSYLRHLITGYEKGTIATQKVTLVWVVRSSNHLAWVRPWMDIILALPKRKEVLTVKLFVTKPKCTAEVHSPSSTVQMFPGRPNIKSLMDIEVAEQAGAMCVTVCGPGGLADNVRHTVRSLQGQTSIDFIEEAFTW